MPELGTARPAPDTPVHISSAVVRTLPAREAEIIEQLRRLPDTEVFHHGNGRIVIVLEGSDSGTIGGRLAQIALLDGVLSASLVYEQVETLQSLGEVS